jgi:hypothetical protein
MQVTFPKEPQGYLHNFLKSFQANVLTEEDLVFAAKIKEISKNVVEIVAFSSLRERWAREGLVADDACDLQSLHAASNPRPEVKQFNLMILS